MNFIETHCHLDGEEFAADLNEVILRAKDAGCAQLLIPAINQTGLQRIFQLCADNPGWAYPMLGLHPEEVNANYTSQLTAMHTSLSALMQSAQPPVAIGEVGLDYYWSRDYYHEQQAAFEQQVKWAAEYQLPLMIHCRKAQVEMVKILRRYENNLVGGIFHCFTGNEQEATELLSFRHFALGIGGVLTFKKSKLPETLSAAVPLSRIVLETDSPYMAPVPMRGTRNEPSFIPYIINHLAEAYSTSPEHIANQTTENARNIFSI